MVRYVLIENDDKLTVRFETDEMWKALSAQKSLLSIGVETHLYSLIDHIGQIKLGGFDA